MLCRQFEDVRRPAGASLHAARRCAFAKTVTFPPFRSAAVFGEGSDREPGMGSGLEAAQQASAALQAEPVLPGDLCRSGHGRVAPGEGGPGRLHTESRGGRWPPRAGDHRGGGSPGPIPEPGSYLRLRREYCSARLREGRASRPRRALFLCACPGAACAVGGACRGIAFCGLSASGALSGGAFDRRRALGRRFLSL